MIRPAIASDLAALKTVIDASDLFPSEMLEDMMSNYFNDENSGEFWFADDQDGEAVAVAYCAPERMTEGTWNLYLIAVHPDCQGKGGVLRCCTMLSNNW